MSAYDEAVATLYQAPLAAFVAERKRLAAALKAAGDRHGAAQFAKLGKPTASTWTVNQLYWQARAELDAMFATAARLRAGELAATAAHREALAQLRVRAANLLADGGHGATESVLRRVMTTLAALAAIGSFAPDPPGALVEDRDPPGFEAANAIAFAPPRVVAAPEVATPQAPRIDGRGLPPAGSAAEERRGSVDELAARRAVAAAAAERQREAEAKRLAAERSRLTAALATARAEVTTRERAISDARNALATAEAAAIRARTIADELAAKLATLA